MEYTPYIKGKSTHGSRITIETPVFQWEKLQDGTIYIRYEDTTEEQYIERVKDGHYEKTYALWSDRNSASTSWSPLAFSSE